MNFKKLSQMMHFSLHMHVPVFLFLLVFSLKRKISLSDSCQTTVILIAW